MKGEEVDMLQFFHTDTQQVILLVQDPNANGLQ